MYSLSGIFVLLFSVFVSNSLVNGAYFYEVQKIEQCKLETPSMPEEWITMQHSCSDLMMKQVKEELRASLTYLAMGAHFSRDTVNRPGFAKFFFESANEERQHAIKFIDYLTMRGNLTDYQHILNIIPTDVLKSIPTSWDSAADAIEASLRLETSVTELIKSIIIECEAGNNVETPQTIVNDYHLADWLTGEFLEEQYQGQRDLAGKLTTLRKFKETHGKLGEFLFDKKLL